MTTRENRSAGSSRQEINTVQAALDYLAKIEQQRRITESRVIAVCAALIAGAWFGLIIGAVK